MKKDKQKADASEIELLENLFEFIVPKFREAHDIMVSMLDFRAGQLIRIVDLGCGFGVLSSRLLELLPKATVFGLDNSLPILNRCCENLASFSDRFISFQRDLNETNWLDSLTPLDAVVSSFTLDYLPYKRHKALIEEAHSLLNKEGRWITCEFFRAEDMRINRIFHDLEIQFIQNAIQSGKISKTQVDMLSNSSILRQKHHVCTVDEKIEWLRKAGYRQVEVPWRFLNLAVTSAIK